MISYWSTTKNISPSSEFNSQTSYILVIEFLVEKQTKRSEKTKRKHIVEKMLYKSIGSSIKLGKSHKIGLRLIFLGLPKISNENSKQGIQWQHFNTFINKYLEKLNKK